MDDDPPIYRELAAERDRAPVSSGAPARHRWIDEPDTEEVPVGRHGDHDGDGLANQADPDWPGTDDEEQQSPLDLPPPPDHEPPPDMYAAEG